MNALLIDDHPLINAGLASCLEATGRFSAAAQASSLADARRFIEESKTLPSLIILDILLGDENGLEFLSYLENFCRAKKVSKPPILVCSVLEDPFRIQSALKLGASGYVSKTGGTEELLRAIDTVLKGEVYLADKHQVKLSESSGVYNQFTKREREILDMVKQDKTNQYIANALRLSIRTVENHISNIYFKTGRSTRQELMKL